MGFGTWLLSMVPSVLGRLLTTLGFSVVSIVGLQAALAAVLTLMQGQVNSFPADMLQLFLFGGGGEALGIIMGAAATKMTLWAATSATRILGTAAQ